MENLKLTIKQNFSVEIYNFDKKITTYSNLIECIECYYKNNEIKIQEIVYGDDIISETAKKLFSLLDPNIPDRYKIEYDNFFFEAQICVPFRARGKNIFRKEQLERFVKHISFYMKTIHPTIRYRIIIVEQNNDRPFNRGFLLNIAFKECEKRPNGYIKYYIHHNCDLFPEIKSKKILDYSYPGQSIRDIFGFFNGLGGICIINRNTFKLINGFPNNMITWGNEDSLIADRCKNNKIKISRPIYNECVIEENHLRDDIHHNLNILNGQDDNINWAKNGLNTLFYKCKINETTEFKNDNLIHYLADFHI